MKKKVLKEYLKNRGLKTEVKPDENAGTVEVKAIKPKKAKKGE